MPNFGLDRYNLDARLKPALLALLPALLLVAAWWQDAWTTVASLVGVVATCGLLFLLSRIARHRGRLLQQKLELELGGLPSALALRHRDQTIDPQTKERYHTFLRSQGVRVPSADEESLSAKQADLQYASCTKWLLEATRDTTRFSMLFDENIDYGFRRNLLGLKPVALVVLAFVFGANSLLLLATNPAPLLGLLLEAALIGMAVTWIIAVNARFVRDAAWAYGVRLVACCDALSQALSPPPSPHPQARAQP